MYDGGNGVVREMQFTRLVTLSVLTERRVTRPYGLLGGNDGLPGLNLLCQHPFTEDSRDTAKWINLGGKCSVQVQPGGRLRLYSPGGGGFGSRKQPSNMAV